MLMVNDKERCCVWIRISYKYEENKQFLIDRAKTRIGEIGASYKDECVKYPEQIEEIMRRCREDKRMKSAQRFLNEMIIKSNPALIIQAENDEEKKILEDYYKKNK